MDTLLTKYGEKIKGVLEGSDRIVFKGILKPISFAIGMQMFLSRQGILIASAARKKNLTLKATSQKKMV
jgi:hypothetical protein